MPDSFLRWWEVVGEGPALGRQGKQSDLPGWWNYQNHRPSFAHTYTFCSSIVPISPKYPTSCTCKSQAFNTFMGKCGPQRERETTSMVLAVGQKKISLGADHDNQIKFCMFVYEKDSK